MCKPAGIANTTRAELGLCKLLWAISSLFRCYFGRGEGDLSFSKNISAPIREELPHASISTVGPLQNPLRSDLVFHSVLPAAFPFSRKKDF